MSVPSERMRSCPAGQMNRASNDEHMHETRLLNQVLQNLQPSARPCYLLVTYQSPNSLRNVTDVTDRRLGRKTPLPPASRRYLYNSHTPSSQRVPSMDDLAMLSELEISNGVSASYLPC